MPARFRSGFSPARLGLIGWRDGLWPLWFPVVVFAPFVVDASVTLARRALAGERVWEAHRSHYYQRLVLIGWSHRRTAFAEYGLMLRQRGGGIACLRSRRPGSRPCCLPRSRGLWCSSWQWSIGAGGAEEPDVNWVANPRTALADPARRGCRGGGLGAGVLAALQPRPAARVSGGHAAHAAGGGAGAGAASSGASGCTAGSGAMPACTTCG